MLYKQLKYIKDERGSASIIEYSMILPICFIVILFIFIVGFFLNQRALLDSAANRSILIAQKVYADPKYTKLVSMDFDADEDMLGIKDLDNSFNRRFKNDPYRFLSNKYKEDEMNTLTSKKVESIVKSNQLFVLDNRVGKLTVHPLKVEGIIPKKATLVLQQRFYVPLLLGHLSIDSGVDMYAKASITIVSPPELIRNTDLVIDTIEDITGKDDITGSLIRMFDKVSRFFEKTKETKE